MLPPPPASFTPLKVNFQPSNVATVNGHAVDAGKTFSLQEGQTFGWTVSHTDAIFDSNLNPNQLLDTHVAVNARARWELAVPNGKYTVNVGVGAASIGTRNNVWVEGVNLSNYQSLPANSFQNNAITVNVTDGKLTVGVGSAPAATTRINSIEVTAADVPAPFHSLVVAPATVTVPEGSVATSMVSLSVAPTSNVVVAVAKTAGGDACLSANGSTLTFTPSNWSTPQALTIAAAEDADSVDGTAFS